MRAAGLITPFSRHGTCGSPAAELRALALRRRATWGAGGRAHNPVFPPCGLRVAGDEAPRPGFLSQGHVGSGRRGPRPRVFVWGLARWSRMCALRESGDIAHAVCSDSIQSLFGLSSSRTIIEFDSSGLDEKEAACSTTYKINCKRCSTT